MLSLSGLGIVLFRRLDQGQGHHSFRCSHNLASQQLDKHPTLSLLLYNPPTNKRNTHIHHAPKKLDVQQQQAQEERLLR